MKRSIISIENTYFESYEVIGFCQGGSLVLIENNAESLAEKCSDIYWSNENDIFPVRADLLDNTDQKSESFIKWSRDNKSAEVLSYYPRPNGSVTVIRYKLHK